MSEVNAGGASENGMKSIGSIRLQHLTMMEDINPNTADGGSGVATKVSAFVEHLCVAGNFIADPQERREAQGILDYWSAELVGLDGVDLRTWTQPKLAQFSAGPEAPETEAGRADDREADLRIKKSREEIRIAALARQWRENGQQRGYLLTDKALQDALLLKGRDADVDVFLDASINTQYKSLRWSRGFYAVVALALLLSTIAIFWQWRIAEKARAQAVLTGQNLADENKRVKSSYKELREEVEKSIAERKKLELALAEAQSATQQNKAVYARQLDELRQDLGNSLLPLVKSGDLPRDRLSPSVLALLDENLRQRNDRQELQPLSLPGEYVREVFTADRNSVADNPRPQDLNGYVNNFAQVDIPMPTPEAEYTNVLLDAGKQIKFVNYSVILHTQRRMAALVANGIDRQALLPISRGSNEQVQADARIPQDLHIDDSFYRAAQRIDRGHLAPRTHIAWGPYFENDPSLAPLRLNLVVNTPANITPQYDDFNRGIWVEVERWVLLEHNKSARYVSEFSGPVFDVADPLADVVGDDSKSVQIPRRYWKIAVSQRSGTKGELIVDAFILPQLLEGSSAPAPRAKFDPEKYRASVSDIEKLIRFEFHSSIRNAETSKSVPVTTALSRGDRIMANLRALDAPGETERLAAAVEIINFFSSRKEAEGDQRSVASSLADFASAGSVKGLTGEGRHTLVFTLAKIPKSFWEKPTWIDIQAKLRKNLADVVQMEATNDLQFDAKTREYLVTLKSNIGFGSDFGLIIDFQFAGYSKAEAEAARDSLQRLGWNIPGAENVQGKIKGKVNETRYGPPANSRIAELLAADMRAAGFANVQLARRVKSVLTNRVEAWISK